MLNALITGSSRGLGLELVKQLAVHHDLKGGIVVATARTCSPQLKEVISTSNGAVVFVALDVADAGAIANSAEEVRSALGGRSLDVLINCAGVHSETHGKVTLMSDLDWQLSVNVTGTHNVLRQCVPLMQSSNVKKVVSVSSAYGSISHARDVAYAPCPAYKISKAALNALTVQYALSYEDDGFVFFAVNPGWLKSDMGGQDADLTVPQGAKAVLEMAFAADSRDNGTFKNIDVPGWDKYNGQILAW
ncbi:hydroxyacyl dehydrogenase [Aspergillus brunneoviolaceus CBS 621.78]|uniref:Hydroxyacyl dehydrogenase n=1 Tax=Aspergillus brunneoviolaceus CBS 621.78 TaxID=1450534 RepID=A0ACD1G2V8_9EURO|nr:hydroxyacyl dehydrogenase [Aspergillus brunneoviolaceus CBS 621.78]RAH43550.1 hydroxyacyl dehydrogenase [Aspergillus brunneoviolaceus CBS 621.78]